MKDKKEKGKRGRGRRRRKLDKGWIFHKRGNPRMPGYPLAFLRPFS
jgi:hypothetical protein